MEVHGMMEVHSQFLPGNNVLTIVYSSASNKTLNIFFFGGGGYSFASFKGQCFSLASEHNMEKMAIWGYPRHVQTLPLSQCPSAGLPNVGPRAARPPLGAGESLLFWVPSLPTSWLERGISPPKSDVVM